MARSTSSPGIAGRPSVPGHEIPWVRRRSVVLNLILSLRPGQWTKNLLVFAGLLFGRRLLDAVSVGRAVAAFAIFARSRSVYVINDVLDRSDRRHPHAAADSSRRAVGGDRSRGGRAGDRSRWPRRSRSARVAATAMAYMVLLSLYWVPQAHRDYRRADGGHRLRPARRGRALGVDVEISHGCSCARCCWRSSSPSPNGATSWCCSPTAPRAIAAFSARQPLSARPDDFGGHGVHAHRVFFYTISPKRSRSSHALARTHCPFPLADLPAILPRASARGGGSPAELLITDSLLIALRWGSRDVADLPAFRFMMWATPRHPRRPSVRVVCRATLVPAS